MCVRVAWIGPTPYMYNVLVKKLLRQVLTGFVTSTKPWALCTEKEHCSIQYVPDSTREYIASSAITVNEIQLTSAYTAFVHKYPINTARAKYVIGECVAQQTYRTKADVQSLVFFFCVTHYHYILINGAWSTTTTTSMPNSDALIKSVTTLSLLKALILHAPKPHNILPNVMHALIKYKL